MIRQGVFMFLTTLVLASFFVAITAARIAAQEAPNCRTWEAMQQSLAAGYGERLVALGVRSAGGVLAILTNPDGTTWTAVIVSPAGQACIVDFGENLADHTPPPEAPGEDS
jgi:hypothetical protein